MGYCRQLCKFQYFKEIQSIIFVELKIDYMLGSYPNIYQPMQALNTIPPPLCDGVGGGGRKLPMDSASGSKETLVESPNDQSREKELRQLKMMAQVLGAHVGRPLFVWSTSDWHR